MSFLRKKPLLTLGLLVLLVIGIPAAIFLSQRQADDRSRAAASTKLSFTPSSTSASPLTVPPGGQISVDVMVDPGTNQVSFLQTELVYDATKFEVTEGGFQVNQQAFPTTIQGPFYSSGKVSFSVSVGADGTKAIQSPAKVGTLTLKALNSQGVSQVTFASNSQALSIDPNSTPRENVVSGTSPAYLQVGTTQATVTPGACADSPSNTMLVVDTSGSMSVASTANKITQAKEAAKNYIDIIDRDTRNLVGLVSYENTATVKSPLTNSYQQVKDQLDSLVAIGSTCTECGILKANQEIAKNPNSNKDVVILLTDGIANFIEGNPNQVETSLAEQRAIAAAVAGHNANGTVFYTIGLGTQINSAFLQQIAASSGGKYFASPTADQLNSIYNQISQIVGKGSVSGFVFNDANNNRAYDTNEQKLSGWTLRLSTQSSAAPQTFTSDSNGFSISGLCDGTYNLKQDVQTGWTQTLPTDPNGYTLNITNGNAITDRNFGNKRGGTCADGIDNNSNNYADTNDPACHTDGEPTNPETYDPDLPEEGNTCADRLDNNSNNLIDVRDPICHTDGNPNNPDSYDPMLPETGGTGTNLSLTVLLHGIGNSGDNVNQNLHSLSNKNPIHKTRTAEVLIYDTANKLMASSSGEIKYASASGDFRGNVVTDKPLPAGSYNVRIRSAQYLTRLIPAIQNITSGTHQLPAVHLVAGDIFKDNKLNILDYNLLIGCHSVAPDPSCTGELKIQTDLDDNGVVNIEDYNLFLREIANQPGE
jgi:Mg-chelatase subunit ChlD